jgi:hypothetical protein
MLRIRREQLNNLETAVLERYVRELTDYIRTEDGDEEVFLPGRPDWIPVKELPNEVLFRMVSAGVARARLRGLALDCDIAAFVSLMFTFAPNFDAQPTIRAVLSEGKSQPEEVMDFLLESVGEEDWQQAEDSYDESAWGLRS